MSLARSPVRKALYLLHPAGLYRWLIRPGIALSRDVRLGLNTTTTVRWKRLGFGRERGTHYTPSHWNVLHTILEPGDIVPTDVFLDAGCGKGLVLCEAMSLPFSRIIGFELSASLCAVARKNLNKVARSHPGVDTEIVVADATEYHSPADVSVVFMFNPFIGDVFTTFLDNLVADTKSQSGRLLLIYNNPVMHDEVMRRGFTLERSKDFVARPRSTVNLYRLSRTAAG